jgi:TP901 family phage tail tape measure protein
MADRTVRVTLSLIASNYNRGMQEVQRSTERATRSAEERLNAQRQAMEELGKTGLTIGAVIGAGIALAVSKFADFDQAMSSVQAATHETAANMGLLREAALDAGASTVFSATEAANAIEELSKAGVSTADILGGALAGSLDLASAGGLDVAQAAEIAATAMTQFNLEGSEVPHIADLLAAGAGKAQGSVEDLSAALNQGGLVAAQTGLSIEETTGGLAAFASAGLVGSDAGTSFKTMLQRLTPQSAEARERMDELGISAYDAQGQFIGLEAFAGNLQGALKDLTPEARNAALSVIFGSDAVRGASVLYNQGAEGIAEWTSKVNDTGYAAETARIKLDNLKGDVEALGGAFDTALINSGSSANEILRTMVQMVTGLVTTFGNLPGPVLGVGLGIAALSAGVLILGGGFLTLIPRIAATRLAMQELNLTGASVAKGFGKGGGILLALTALTSGVAGLGAQGELTARQLAQVDLAVNAFDFSNIERLFGKATTAVVGNTEEMSGALNSLKNISGGFNDTYQSTFTKFVDGLTFGLTSLSDVYTTNEATYKQIGVALGEIADQDYGDASSKFKALVKELGGGEDTIKRLLEVMPEYEASLTALAGAQGQTLTDQELYNLAIGEGSLAASLARDASAKQAEALSELSGVAETAEGDINDLADTITDFGKAQFDVNSATREFQSAIDDASEALEKNGQNLDVTTEAGRANQAALDGIAQSSLAVSAAIITQTGDQQAASAAILEGREAYIAASVAAGISEEAANTYADQLGLIPSNVSTAIVATGVTKTQEEIDAIQANLAQTIRQLTIQIDAAVDRRQLDGLLASIRSARSELSDLNGAASGSGRMGTYATGGAIHGPGTGTSDSIMALVSNGEHILTKREVDLMGGHSAVYAWRNQVKAGRLPGFAAGGAVQYMPTRSAGSTRVSVSPSVSLAGARLVMSVGGRQMEAVIQDQIVASKQQSGVTIANRRQRGK